MSADTRNHFLYQIMVGFDISVVFLLNTDYELTHCFLWRYFLIVCVLERFGSFI